MIIVKLGGSLYQSNKLKLWLKELTHLSEQQTILIVPGGGPFADQVRQAQQQYLFDDSHAHHMAIIAMAQFGLLIAGIESNCKLFYYTESTAVPDSGPGLFVWLPDRQLLSQEDLSHSWEFTSDSLALWLANQLQATQLILVKAEMAMPSHSIQALSQTGIIDEAFPPLFDQSTVPVRLLTANNFQQLMSNTGFLSND